LPTIQTEGWRKRSERERGWVTSGRPKAAAESKEYGNRSQHRQGYHRPTPSERAWLDIAVSECAVEKYPSERQIEFRTAVAVPGMYLPMAMEATRCGAKTLSNIANTYPVIK